MAVEEGGIQIRKYWDLEYQERESPHAVEEFQNLLEESVRLRLISEVPLGVFLSGGLDSSAMLAMMSKITGGERVKTFSVGYDTSGPAHAEAEEANELSYARQAAAHFGAEHHEFCLTATDFRNAMMTMVSHLDEPMADPSCIPLYF